jgi:hypothetical protein
MRNEDLDVFGNTESLQLVVKGCLEHITAVDKLTEKLLPKEKRTRTHKALMSIWLEKKVFESRHILETTMLETLVSLLWIQDCYSRAETLASRIADSKILEPLQPPHHDFLQAEHLFLLARTYGGYYAKVLANFWVKGRRGF